MTVTSADEFYSIMAVLTREMLEFGLMDANNLINVSIFVNEFTCPSPTVVIIIIISTTKIIFAHVLFIIMMLRINFKHIHIVIHRQLVQ